MRLTCECTGSAAARSRFVLPARPRSVSPRGVTRRCGARAAQRHAGRPRRPWHGRRAGRRRGAAAAAAAGSRWARMRRRLRWRRRRASPLAAALARRGDASPSWRRGGRLLMCPRSGGGQPRPLPRGHPLASPAATVGAADATAVAGKAAVAAMEECVSIWAAAAVATATRRWGALCGCTALGGRGKVVSGAKRGVLWLCRHGGGTHPRAVTATSVAPTTAVDLLKTTRAVTARVSVL